MENCKSVSTPIIKNSNTDDFVLNTKYPYREAVGSLLYLANKTRPDISYAVSYCSRFLDKSTDADVANVKRIMRYLNTSHGSCINYYKDADPAYIEAYSDADYAGDIDSGKSTTGYVINYCGFKADVV